MWGMVILTKSVVTMHNIIAIFVGLLGHGGTGYTRTRGSRLSVSVVRTWARKAVWVWRMCVSGLLTGNEREKSKKVIMYSISKLHTVYSPSHSHTRLFLVGPRLVPPPSTTDDARIHLGALNGLPEGPSHDLREAAGRVRVAQGLRR